MGTVSRGTGRKRAAAAPAPKKPRKGPGRPEGESKLKDAILDASEAIFADLGYAGTTLRVVAAKAHVTQALISYYFGTKYGLFEAVFMRRGRAIGEQRVHNLQALRAGGKAPTLRQIVRAFLTPTLELRGTPAGRDFLRLQARLHTEPPEISYRLRNEAYDSSTRLYVEALRTAVPSLSLKDAYWRMTLMVGAYMYVFSDTHRLEELAPGVCDPEDPQEIIDQITTFVVAGFRAKG
jgi:AcrR family transcriptional regulator